MYARKLHTKPQVGARSQDEAAVEAEVKALEALVKDHDVIFLLTDTRER